jgi:hypothetical protein
MGGIRMRSFWWLVQMFSGQAAGLLVTQLRGAFKAQVSKCETLAIDDLSICMRTWRMDIVPASWFIEDRLA